MPDSELDVVYSAFVCLLYASALYSPFCCFYHLQNIEKFREKAEKKQMELTQAEEAANGPDEEETLKRAALDELIQEAQEQTQKKIGLDAGIMFGNCLREQGLLLILTLNQVLR